MRAGGKGGEAPSPLVRDAHEGRPPLRTRLEALRTVTKVFVSAATETLTIGGRITGRTTPALVSVR